MSEKKTSDLVFIAKMLHEVIVVQGYTSNFYICEAWEVAKKYYRADAGKGAGE